MPIYTYQIINEDGSEGAIVELEHRMSDPVLERHPQTGERLRRVIVSPPAVGGPASSGRVLSDNNLADKGFTKYVKTADGRYEKTVGEGPKSISRD